MNNELLALLDYFEQEKDIDKETLFQIVEEALTLSSEKEHPDTIHPRVVINRRTGEFTTWAKLIVVEEVGDRRTEISLEDSLEIYPNSEIEDVHEFVFESSKTFSIADLSSSDIRTSVNLS